MTDDNPGNLRDLALLAQQRNDGMSARRLAEKAERQGYVLSRTTTSKIIAGTYMSRPSSETVEALAYLAGVRREIAYEASGIAFPYAPLAEQLPPGADALNAGQRRVIVDLAREFVKQNQQIDEIARTLAGHREDDDATQAEDEGRRDPDVQGAGDRAPMIDLAQARRVKEDPAGFGDQRRRGDLDQGKLQPPPPAEKSAAWRTRNRGKEIRKKQDRDD